MRNLFNYLLWASLTLAALGQLGASRAVAAEPLRSAAVRPQGASRTVGAARLKLRSRRAIQNSEPGTLRNPEPVQPTIRGEHDESSSPLPLGLTTFQGNPSAKWTTGSDGTSWSGSWLGSLSSFHAEPLGSVEINAVVRGGSGMRAASMDALWLIAPAAEVRGREDQSASWFGVAANPGFGWQSTDGPARYQGNLHVGVWAGKVEKREDRNRIDKRFAGFVGVGYGAYWISGATPPIGESSSALGGVGLHGQLEYVNLTTSPGISFEADLFGMPDSPIFELWSRIKAPIAVTENVQLSPAFEVRYRDTGANAKPGVYFASDGAAYVFRLHHLLSAELSAGLEWWF